jgi:hypothetical protein
LKPIAADTNTATYRRVVAEDDVQKAFRGFDDDYREPRSYDRTPPVFDKPEQVSPLEHRARAPVAHRSATHPLSGRIAHAPK